jgi:cytochrome c556
MNSKIIAILVVFGSLVTGFVNAYAAEVDTHSQDIKLSPDLLKLLRAEMHEIAGGVQGVALSLTIADWKSIQDTSAKIRASYIMEQKLTKAQSEELEKTLPEYFKQLDAAFHQRAEKLGEAAASRDPELAAFQYSRLLESCAHCHSVFARKRFPGFASQAPKEHHH